jgi:4-hydroxy-tetrahydrodipicolinate reductase
MGRIACAAISGADDLELVATVGRTDDHQAILMSCHADVAVDFTTPSAVFVNAMKFVEARCRPVIGTSGLLPEQIEELRRLCAVKSVGCLIVPNFSLTAILMTKLAQSAVKHFGTVEIIEYHHDKKLDSPSGTAIRTAELLGEVNSDRARGIETLQYARGASHHGIGIHSVRMPGLLAHQEILLGKASEMLTIRSDVFSRDAYADGIRLACREVMRVDDLTIGLEQLV